MTVGEINVSVNTEDIEYMVLEGDRIVKSIASSLNNIDLALDTFRNSEIIKGEAAKGLEEFIDTVKQDIVQSNKAFNEKTLNAAKVIYHQFNQETYLGLG